MNEIWTCKSHLLHYQEVRKKIKISLKIEIMELFLSPWKVSARLMDWEERAVRKPRPSEGIIVDWQRKASTELPSWPPSASSLGRSVTLSLQTAALWPWQKTDDGINNILWCNFCSFQVCVLYLSSTQADIEEVVVLCAFRSEAGPVHDGPSGRQSTEVIPKSPILVSVCERTVAETHTVLLWFKQPREDGHTLSSYYYYSQNTFKNAYSLTNKQLEWRTHNIFIYWK